MDADAIVVGAGLAGLAAARRAGRRRPAGAAAGPGAGAVPRRAGVLVARRPVPRRQPRAAPDGRQGLARPGPAGLVRLGAVRPARGPLAAAVGRGVRALRRRREAVLAATDGRTGSSRWSGWAERGDGRADGHGNSVPRFHVTWGTGPGVRRAVRAAGARARRDRADRASGSGTGSTSWSRTTAPSPAYAARSWSRRRSSAARRQSRVEVGDFELRRAGGDGHLRRHRRRPRPGPRRPGRRGSAQPPKRMVAGVPAHVDGRMLAITAAGRRQHHQPRPDVALHRGPAELGPDLGRTTASGSCPARRRCGSTPRASGCRRRTSRASTPSARSGT